MGHIMYAKEIALRHTILRVKMEDRAAKLVKLSDILRQKTWVCVLTRLES